MPIFLRRNFAAEHSGAGICRDRRGCAYISILRGQISAFVGRGVASSCDRDITKVRSTERMALVVIFVVLFATVVKGGGVQYEAGSWSFTSYLFFCFSWGVRRHRSEAIGNWHTS